MLSPQSQLQMRITKRTGSSNGRAGVRLESPRLSFFSIGLILGEKVEVRKQLSCKTVPISRTAPCLLLSFHEGLVIK